MGSWAEAQMTERALLDVVVECARRLGWLVCHQRPALNRRGHWATHLQGFCLYL